MRTTNQHIQSEVQRYIDFGYSIEGACKQVDSLYLGRHSVAVAQVKQQLLKAA